MRLSGLVHRILVSWFGHQVWRMEITDSVINSLEVRRLLAVNSRVKIHGMRQQVRWEYLYILAYYVAD